VPEESVVVDGGALALSAAEVAAGVVGVAVEDVAAASEEDGSGALLPVSVAVPVAADVGADALDEITVGIAETDDVVRLMTVGAAVDEDAEEIVADGDTVSELAADDVVAVAVADEVVRTTVEGGAVPVLADELTVAELDAVPVAVVETVAAEVVLSVRVAELLEVTVAVTELLVVAAVPVAVADEEMAV
jgi:hypothetical protein